MWGEQFEGFDSDQFTLIVIDPLGYGQSEGERIFDVEMFTKDAVAADALMQVHKAVDDNENATQELGYTPYTVLGWGDGGITALHMAANEAILKNIRKMVVYAAQAYVTSPDVQRIQSELLSCEAFFVQETVFR